MKMEPAQPVPPAPKPKKMRVLRYPCPLWKANFAMVS
jgi:hypothetical protein